MTHHRAFCWQWQDVKQSSVRTKSAYHQSILMTIISYLIFGHFGLMLFLLSLGEILKLYAKEVIMQQPADIFEFSAQYFAQMDELEEELQQGTIGRRLF